MQHFAQGADGVSPVVVLKAADLVDPRLTLETCEPRDRARRFGVDELLLAENH